MQKGKDKIKVLITGATGAAGSGVLDACLKDPRIESITAVTRKPLPFRDQKIVEVLHDDFLDYSAIEDRFKGHEACFWCLGISQSKVRKEEAYTRITYGFTLAAAKVLERLNPGMTFCFLSGMGTDATERWPIEEFKSYTKARFESGGGWTYHMKSRFIYVSEDGNTAWFDELLHNENLGLTRGTGVLVNQDGNWLISQYNLTIPVPNQLARDLAARIRALEN